MAGFLGFFRRHFHVPGEGRLWVRRPPVGDYDMREYNRHEVLRHRWIDHD